MSTATAAKTRKKIELLRTLIDHPRTGEDERDTARRMLARLIGKATKDGDALDDVTGATGWYSDRRVYGAKYEQVRHLNTTQIAALIRQDIKLARKIAAKAAEPGAVSLVDPLATLPAEIKISVRSQYFSGGSSIDIRLKNIPRDWGYSMQPLKYRPQESAEQPTPALRAVADELRAILKGYNYDGSDPYTDYFDVNFYGNVMDERGLSL